MKNLARTTQFVTAAVFFIGVGAGVVWWHKENVHLYSIPAGGQIEQFSPGDLVVTVDGAGNRKSQVKGRVVADITAGGYIFDFLRKPVSMIAIVYLPAMLIAAAELKKAAGHRSYKPYKIAQYL